MSFFENDTAFAAFLREQADKHKMFPADKVWYNVQEKIHGRKKWPALGITGFLVLLLATLATVTLDNDSVLTRYKKLPTKYDVSVAGGQLDSNHRILSLFLQEVDVMNRFAQEPSVVAANYYRQKNYSSEAFANNSPAKSTEVISNGAAGFIENSLPTNPPQSIERYALVEERIGYRGTYNDTMPQSLPADELNVKYIPKQVLPPFSVPTLVSVGKSKLRRWSIGFSIAGGSSFRNLYANSATNTTSFVAIPMASNINIDINEAAKHTPGFGMEASVLFGYKLNSAIKFLAGLQYNYRRYNIAVSGHSFDATRLQLANASAITLAGQYSNVGNYYPLTISNSIHEISIPLGVQVSLLQGKKLAWVVDAFVQPTHVLDKEPFTLSTDFKSYVNGTPLTRNWNINTAVGTNLQYKTGTTTWQIGPQFRYQQLPTYKDAYPVKEHWYDVSLRIGFMQNF